MTSAIFKVIRTSQDDFALGCSAGMYFTVYDSRFKKFIKQPEFFMVDHVVTQLIEISPNRFAVGCWNVPWIAIVDKKQRTLIRIDCPLSDETQCTDLVPLPGFNPRMFPFILQRNNKAVNLVNLATLTMNRLLMRPNQQGSF